MSRAGSIIRVTLSVIRVRRRGSRWLAAGIALAGAGVATAARQAEAHPLHTTLSEMSALPDGSVQIVVRAFIDDFSAAVTRRPATTVDIPTPADSAISRYLAETLVLADAAGRRASLSVTGTRRTGDLVWITVRASLRAAGGVRLTNRILFERWDDQVNIVQAALGARRETLLFTRRDGSTPKPIGP